MNTGQTDGGTGQQAAYAPATEREAGIVMELCERALSAIPYVEIESSNLQDSHGEMILITGRASSDRFPPETVRLDLSSAWQSALSRESTSMHDFLDTGDQYNFRFTILQGDGTFLTGRFAISRP